MPQTKKGSIPKISYDVQVNGVVSIARCKISVKDWSDIVAYVDEHPAYRNHKNRDYNKSAKKTSTTKAVDANNDE